MCWLRGLIARTAVLTALAACGAAAGEAVVTETTATGLTLALDARGRLARLEGGGADRLVTDEESCFISIRDYARDGAIWKVAPETRKPERMTATRLSPTAHRLTFAFAPSGEVELRLENKGTHLRAEIVRAASATGVARVQWGPWTTTLHDSVGDYLGVVRNRDFAFGALALDGRTDGLGTGGMAFVAAFRQGPRAGGLLRLFTVDHTRPVRHNRGFSISTPVPEARLEGAAVALWGVARPTKDRELDAVEQIVRAEGLPYPTLDGVWVKRAPRANESAFWIYYTDRDIDDWIRVAEVAGVHVFSRYNCFANWGHFDPDPQAFTNGWASLRECSDKARAKGIRTTTYTLSNFTRAHLLPEAFIAPKLDPRFGVYADSGTTLARPLPGPAEGARARPKFDFLWRHDLDLPGEIVSNRVHLVKTAAAVGQYGYVADVTCEKVKMMSDRRFLRKFINVDGELVCYRAAATNETELILLGCERGFYGSPIRAHAAGAPVVRLDSYDGYDSLLPGCDAMNDEIAANIAAATRRGGMGHHVLDGVECADHTGNDLYSVNRFIRAVVDGTPRGSTFTGSRMTHYTWHLYTNQSWGEHDLKHGIRGSQFEARLRNQIILRRSDFPNKIGQYYPDHCSLADIDWIMAFAAAYDAGVDFEQSLPKGSLEKFERIRLWEDARRAGFFTARDKLLMRQTDTEWRLARTNGTFRLTYAGRWRGKGYEELAPTNAPLRTRTGNVRFAPRSIDRDWAHSPGQFERWCLTDDIQAALSTNAVAFEVASPVLNETYGDTVPLVVLRAVGGDLMNPMLRFRVRGRDFHLRLKTTLRRGTYLTIPHRVPQAFVYDADHTLLRGVELEDLPSYFPYRRGETVEVSVVSENARPVPAILNLRFVSSLPGAP